MSTEATSREQIQKEFSGLLKAHDAAASRITTKAESAELQRDQEVVERASSYTVKAIVEGLAGLQLDVGDALDKLSERMGQESSKLGELRRAIVVETRRLASLKNTLVAAEALALLKQDNERKMADFEESSKKALAELDEEIAKQREEWKQESAAHEASVKEFETNLGRERTQSAEERAYDIARKKKVLTDDNAAAKLQLQRELADADASKDKDWAAREKVLTENADELKKLREEAEAMDAKIKEASDKAREKAFASVQRDAKVEAELRQKESTANVEVFELQIKTLEARINEQNAELGDLKTRLAESRERVQKLAVDALKSTTAAKA